MPLNRRISTAWKSLVKDRFHSKDPASFSNLRQNSRVDNDDDWESVSTIISSSNPSGFQAPPVNKGTFWALPQPPQYQDDLVLEQLDVDNSGENYDWREGNYNGEWKDSDRVIALAKRNSRGSRKWVNRRAGSEESLLDTDMDTNDIISTQSMMNLLDSGEFGRQKKSATKRDACGNVVFKEDDWGYIKGYNYNSRDCEDLRGSKCLRNSNVSHMSDEYGLFQQVDFTGTFTL